MNDDERDDDEPETGSANSPPGQTNQSNASPTSKIGQQNRAGNGAEIADQNGNDNEAPAKTFIRRLTLSEWLTFLVGFGTLGVSYLTYRNASDTTDIKHAVAGLAQLAQQTKREADNSDRQIAILANQANGQQAQTKAIGGQTEAIIKQANALIKSASATVKAADADLAAAKDQADAARAISENSIPIISFGGLQMTGIKSKPNVSGQVIFTVKPYFVNVGGISIVPGKTYLHVLFSENLPRTPPSNNEIQFGGNDFSVFPGNGYTASKEPSLSVDLKLRDDLIKRKIKIFVWGKSRFRGARDKFDRDFCFVSQVSPDGDDWTTFSQRSLDNPAYECAERH